MTCALPSGDAGESRTTWFPDGLALTFGSTLSPRVGQGGRLATRERPGGAWTERGEVATVPAYASVWRAPTGESFIEGDPGRGDVILEISMEGDTLWRRDIAGTTPLRRWGHQMLVRASPDGTLYSRGLHKDGSEGVWAIPDYGRGEPRLVVRFDDPPRHVIYMSVGPDRLYLTVQDDPSDIWVATLKR